MAGLYKAIIDHAFEFGIFSCEMSWVLESNEMMCRAAKSLGAHVTKTYRLYEKPLS